MRKPGKTGHARARLEGWGGHRRSAHASRRIAARLHLWKMMYSRRAAMLLSMRAEHADLAPHRMRYGAHSIVVAVSIHTG
jgi:hypothetical protein